MNKFDFAIVGGDKRTAHMSSVLSRKGYHVVCFGTSENFTDNTIATAHTLQEAVTNASIIVCGIPFQKNGCLYFEKENSSIPLSELQRVLRKHHTVFGGMIPEDFRKICEAREIACYDFLSEEPLTIRNAVAAAEGAIIEALLHKDTLLHLSKTLVLGYGRCAKVLADKLKGLSAQVTVCSEQPQELAYAHSLGFPAFPLSELQEKINCFEYIFNTIPSKVLTKNCLEQIQTDSLIIDIASNRIGVDYEAARLLQRTAIFCPGLPGKYASLSCAEQLTEFVLKNAKKPGSHH
ncbi:MAG: dipicolinate synthase [Lachnospiraceae bacterium]|nr:dipicolinate synthase [Lachnospiraceae bacterium]